MVTMPPDAGPLGPDGVPEQRKGRMCGYPGRDELLATQAQLRRALMALARDPGPEARLDGVRLAQAASEALKPIAAMAEDSTTAAKKLRADTERMSRKLDRTLAARRNGKS